MVQHADIDHTGLTGVGGAAHDTSHQNGGADEITVAGLSGLLADDQNPTAHAADHQNAGGDEISVAGLSGLLADGQTPLAHKTSHQDGGADELEILDLATAETDDTLVLAPDGAGGVEFRAEAGGGGGGLDLSGLTIERNPQGLSDYLAGFDASAADERGYPIGMLQLGRSFSVMKNECYSVQAGTMEGLVSSVAGTGASFGQNGTATSGHPGIYQVVTGTTTTGSAHLTQQGGSGSVQVFAGIGKVRFGLICKIPVLSDGTNTFGVYGGLADSTGIPASLTNGIYFRYSSPVNGGRWEAVCEAANVETAVDTGVAADTNWHTLEYEVNAAGTSVEFFIDGVSVATIATNIPTGVALSQLPMGVRKSAGTTSREFHVDAYWYILEFTTSR